MIVLFDVFFCVICCISNTDMFCLIGLVFQTYRQLYVVRCFSKCEPLGFVERVRVLYRSWYPSKLLLHCWWWSSKMNSFIVVDAECSGCFSWWKWFVCKFSCLTYWLWLVWWAEWTTAFVFPFISVSMCRHRTAPVKLPPPLLLLLLLVMSMIRRCWAVYSNTVQNSRQLTCTLYTVWHDDVLLMICSYSLIAMLLLYWQQVGNAVCICLPVVCPCVFLFTCFCVAGLLLTGVLFCQLSA